MNFKEKMKEIYIDLYGDNVHVDTIFCNKMQELEALIRQNEREHIEKEVRKLKYVVLDSSDFNAIKQDVLKIVRNEPKVKDR